jgi:hypothetical protein
MTQLRTIRRCALVAALALSVSLALPACVGTPLPDPPSFAGALVSWSTTPQTDTIRFVGQVGAVHPGGITLRITDPPTPGELVATNADGSFGRVLPGVPGDTIYVERIDTDADVFLGAYTVGPSGVLVPAAAGSDGDGDGTPDVIDCAPADRTMSGQRCAMGTACRTDSDCASGQRCVAGTCAIGAGCTAEVCNGIDDDCDGIVDDGDPGGGVTCMTGPSCGQIACAGTPMCGMVITPLHEVCGNGIDDDCNGIIDDGCP